MVREPSVDENEPSRTEADQDGWDKDEENHIDGHEGEPFEEVRSEAASGTLGGSTSETIEMAA